MRARAPLVAITMVAACTNSERTTESPTATRGSSVNEVAADETRSPEEPGSSNPPKPAVPVSECKLQEGIGLNVVPLKALGTEPFWGARTDGRCVTYSTPEDQAGTRVWAKVESKSGETVWKGSLRGKPFQLRIRPNPGCSDGMSDNEYPLKAELAVDGETRTGCAEPL